MTTRREIIKTGSGLAAIIAAGKAPAVLVRSMIAARNAMLSGGAKTYVTDGLVAMWDVKYMPPSMSEWAATVGTGIDWSLTGTTIDTDGGLQFAGTSSSYGELSAAQSNLVWSNTGTLEVVFKLLNPPSANGGRGGVLLKTPSNSAVGLGLFGRSGTAFLTGRNNTSGRAAVISRSMSWSSFFVDMYGRVSILYDAGSPSYYFNGTSPNSYDSDSIGGSQTVSRIGNRTTAYPFHGNIYAIRFYSRVISTKEISTNSAVDKQRFNLP